MFVSLDSLSLKSVYMNVTLLPKGPSWWCCKETMVPLFLPPPLGLKQDCLTA